ncbi:SRPBCC domain-containing protein [Belliella sp. DSM 111904]|uniref:SRPBCC domain-containing protein n=1 Tax=Belliella filtrata TaxID=2923435 RepID=A0ABS9UZ33_9BACT|nr:SRPBCC domain-containing protein [Belliella filtrata]MCH7409430.1 SRPBCC domain-containing protein [Belliella filtrata]
MESIEQINYIKAPIHTVYNTLTTQEGLGAIWTKKLKVKHEVGYINEFDFDEEYLTKMKIIALQNNRKIEWECIFSDAEWKGTRVIFELSEKGNTTMILLKHSDWKAKTDYLRWCSYNWAMFLFSLKMHCEAIHQNE